MRRSADDIALALTEQHARLAQFTSIYESDETPDMTFSYGVQDRYVAHLCQAQGTDVAGYKIGLTTPRMQKLCGVTEPICGSILRNRILQSPATLRHAGYARLGVESEIAVRVGADIKDAVHSKTTPPLESLIDDVCAAFEIIEDSAADYTKLAAISMVADNSWNAGSVLGPSVRAAELKSLKDREGILYRDGAALDKGSSNDVAGDPLNVVLWLARHLQARARDLEPGQWVSTGSIVPTVFVKPGERYRFTVTGLPPIEVEIT